MRRKWLLCLAVCMSMSLAGFGGTAQAYKVDVCGRPLTIQGYIQQEIDYGLVKHKYETQSGFNSFLTTAMLEMGYMPTDNTKLYASGYFEGDWAYELLGNGRNVQWDRKGFGDSRHHNYIHDDFDDLLHEAHFTWSGEEFYLRVGKQIVQWGETDGQRLANLVNPIDQRRGVTDVKFDTTILPIWMIRAEYNAKLNNPFFLDFGVQFIIDPAFRYRGNEIGGTANNVCGVNAAGVNAGPSLTVGEMYSDIEKPRDFDFNYFTYGLKLKGTLPDGTVVSLLGYYGRDRDYAYAATSPFFFVTANNWDRTKGVLNTVKKGYYPYYKFVGLTIAKEVPQLAFSALSNIAPIFRLESTYAFNTKYGTSELLDESKQYAKTDELAVALTMDYKVRVPWLNPNVGITVNPQFFFQREMNFYHGYGVTGFDPVTYAPVISRLSLNPRLSIYEPLNENSYKFSILLTTFYMHGKLQPMFMWIRDVSNAGDMYLAKLTYTRNQNWSYGLSGVLFQGKYPGQGMEPARNKDKIWATVTYSFN